jgi:putative SOS response-associated peptidase YedK
MCGRLNIIDDPFTVDLLRYFGVASDVVPCLPMFNMGPSESIPIIREQNGHRRSEMAIWSLLLEKGPAGFKPKAGLSTFNARAERLEESRLWRSAYKTRRCLIPATGFYEYKTADGKKHPFFIRPVDRAIVFAGLFREWHHNDRSVFSCALVVTAPHPRLTHIHDKSLPVMLAPRTVDAWLDPAHTDTDDFAPLFRPWLRYDFAVIPVDPSFNRAANKDAACIEPVGQVERLSADRPESW